MLYCMFLAVTSVSIMSRSTRRGCCSMLAAAYGWVPQTHCRAHGQGGISDVPPFDLRNLRKRDPWQWKNGLCNARRSVLEASLPLHQKGHAYPSVSGTDGQTDR